jgi:hypothetical protein
MDEITFENEKEMWKDIATILSKTGNWRYVNRIPTITSMLGYEQFFVTRRKEFILEKFEKASARFDYLKDRNELGERKYFPNMRYVALRLLSEASSLLLNQQHDATFNFPVTLLKTKSRLKPMDEVIY